MLHWYRMLPPDYTPELGDIISFTHRVNGRLSKCIIGEIIEPGFFMPRKEKDSGIGEFGSAFIAKFHVIQSVHRKVGNKIKTVWEPPVL